jgi:hypothetical protein
VASWSSSSSGNMVVCKLFEAEVEFGFGETAASSFTTLSAVPKKKAVARGAAAFSEALKIEVRSRTFLRNKSNHQSIN